MTSYGALFFFCVLPLAIIPSAFEINKIAGLPYSISVIRKWPMTRLILEPRISDALQFKGRPGNAATEYPGEPVVCVVCLYGETTLATILGRSR